jgi:integrase
MALTDTRIRSAKPAPKPFKLTDAGGLYLEVRPTGSKLWRYRYRLYGKENVYALGEYPKRLPRVESEEEAAQRRAGGVLLLAEARQERDRCRALIKQGINPAHQRKLQKLKAAHASRETFEAIASEWVDTRAKEWSQSYRKGVARILNDDLIPALGALPMRNIKPPHLLAVLKRIERRGASTVAAKARFLASEIWRYAVATLRADGDLAATLRGAIRMPEHVHHPALKRDEIPAFLSALERYSGRPETVIAFKLLLLLFPRPGELLGATWEEFDLEGALWRVPGQRMKMRQEHIVPIPRQAIELLRGLQFVSGHRKHLFPHRDYPEDQPMTDNALRQALHVMGFSRKLTPHGFRATASTALNELGYSGDWIEKQLAHEERNRIRAAYHRALYVEERRGMLQAWADLIDGMTKGGNIVPINRMAA